MTRETVIKAGTAIICGYRYEWIACSIAIAPRNVGRSGQTDNM